MPYAPIIHYIMRLINLCKGYLDNAATSRYKPQCVISAVKKELKQSSNPGRGAHKGSIGSAQKIEECRFEVCELTGMPYAVFTKSCTEAINLAVMGMNLSGEVITTVFEHNSILRTLKRLEAQGKIDLRIIRPSGFAVTAKDIRPYLSAKASLLAISEMSNVTGARHEIEEISAAAKEKGIPVLLDCAQSLGHTEADYKDVDMIAASGHKGLYGPQGVGFLAFREIKFKPLICGGTGTDSFNLMQPESYPEGFESGTQNTPCIAGLCEAIKWTRKNKQKIAQKIKYLSARMVEGLKSLNGVKLYYENENGVVSFNVRDIPSGEAANILDAEFGIAVRSGLHCAPLAHRFLGTEKQGAVRASVGWGNRENDIDLLLEGIEYILKNPK